MENLPERDGQADVLGVLCARGLVTDVDTAAITSEAAEVAVVSRMLAAANRNFEMEQKVKRCGVWGQASIMFGVGGNVRQFRGDVHGDAEGVR